MNTTIIILLIIFLILRIVVYIVSKRIKRTHSELIFLLERRKSTLPMLITMSPNTASTKDLVPFADYINTPTILLNNNTIAIQADLSNKIQDILPTLPDDYMPAIRLNKELLALEERIVNAFHRYNGINTYYKMMSKSTLMRAIFGFQKL